jgi:murein DD-endopeptidase MepM/ murein hydrolase activator NlpD
MPLGMFRVATFAWGERRHIGQLIILLAAVFLGLPMVFGIGVSAAVTGMPLPPGSVARPMESWQVSQPFGCTGFVFEPARGGCAHFHSGIDLVAPMGASVRSVLPGVAEVVAPAGYGGGYGIHVIVRHDANNSTMYAHLLAATVRSGQPLSAGAMLGYEGSTGLSTGAHLHFEVRRLGIPIDPVTVFPSLFGAGGPANQPQGTTVRPN